MKVSLKWLKEYVDFELAYQELARKLTIAGMEVNSTQIVGGMWDNVVVGEVMAVNPHPNADRLKLATVDLGDRQVTVVCGAPNVSPGQKVPFAHVGAQLIDGHTGKLVLLKQAKIRGVVSEGVVCSEKELGISDSHEGIMVLPTEVPIGVPLSECLGDVVLDLDITPNRPDCLSIIGVAREVAALTGEKLHLPEIDYAEKGEPIGSFLSIDIIEPNLCPRYCASLIEGVKIASSPDWMQQYLKSYGMRPINNVVDVTNYVMLEYGQPLHAFDYHKLRGKKIIVRRAGGGEAITTLDGVERMLSSDTLVIADGDKAIAIAGVMGGLNTEVTNETSVIVLESANFNQAAIRRGCRHLQLQSEASIRFDKGLNSGLPLLPLKRATQLLLELAGSHVAQGIIDVYPGKPEPKGISLSAEEVKRLSGLEVTVEKIIEVLSSLGFECRETESSPEVSAIAPYWRSDISCSADLVEEVVRIIGYDEVPITRLGAPLPEQESRLSLRAQREDLRGRLRNTLTGWGFQEILTYSLTSLEGLQKLSPKLELKITPLKVANPMTKEQEYLRTSLRAGLLATLAYNQKYEQGGIRLFEIGKIFLPQGKDLPQEKEMLCAVLSGPKWGLSWHGDKDMLDFFDAKGMVENLLNQSGLETAFEAGVDEGLFQGREADIIIGNDRIGVVGDLHPKVAQAFELPDTACLIEVDVEKLLDKAIGLKRYQPVPRFPSVSRDIALVVDEGIIYQQVWGVIQCVPLVKEVTLFDLYTGEQIPEGKKSFAIRVIYQSPDRTLTDEEVDKLQQNILKKLHQTTGASLRS